MPLFWIFLTIDLLIIPYTFVYANAYVKLKKSEVSYEIYHYGLNMKTWMATHFLFKKKLSAKSCDATATTGLEHELPAMKVAFKRGPQNQMEHAYG